MSTNQRNGRGFSSPHSNRSTSSHARRRSSKGADAEAIYKKYVTLARAAALSGDAIETENYYQHAEHYFRMMKDERIGNGLEDTDGQQDRPVSKAAIDRGE